MSKLWKILSAELALDQRWMKVRRETVELPDGKVMDDYFTWLSGDVAIIVPVLPDGRFVLVEQYKHAAGELTLEFPGGFVDLNEEPKVAVLRELKEETGYEPRTLRKVAKLTDNPTKVVGDLHIYLGLDCCKVAEPKFDPSENITTRIEDRASISAKLADGSFRVSGSVAGFFLALQQLNSKSS